MLFRTRWALSYLRGPLTLQEIARLQPPLDQPHTAVDSATPSPNAAALSRPVIPSNVNEYFDEHATSAAPLTPHIFGAVRLHFIDKPNGVDTWQTRTYVAPFGADAAVAWEHASLRSQETMASLTQTAPANARYAQTPASVSRAQSYVSWGKELAAHAHEHANINVWRCALTNGASTPGVSESEFRAQVALSLREKRDAAVETLRKKFAPRLTTLDDQIRRAEDRIERERGQLCDQKIHTALSVGTSLLGALFGRKKISVTNVGRIGTAARSAGRIGREGNDVARAEESLEVFRQRHTGLANEFDQETSRLQTQFDPAGVTIEHESIRPRKSDIEVKEVALVWIG